MGELNENYKMWKKYTKEQTEIPQLEAMSVS